MKIRVATCDIPLSIPIYWYCWASIDPFSKINRIFAANE